MARPLRICEPNLTYHVYSRCSERRELLNDYFKNILLLIIKKAQEKYPFELIAYGIMNNHIHLIIRTLDDGPPISRIMQYVKARLAETYNRQNERTGPFWNERFKDVIVEKQKNPARYLLWLLWYIGYNPVRMGYVTKPEFYPFSSINCYLQEQCCAPVKITLHQYFLSLGKCFMERVNRFRQWEHFLARVRASGL